MGNDLPLNGSSAVRPEHPRPDFRGRMWLNLNGPWNFQFDDYDQGEKEGWHIGEGEFDRKIMVPFPFQSKLSGIQDESFHNTVWYQRSFSIPENFGGKRVLLHFGAVDYETKVWINRSFMGSHRGGYTPFSFDITSHVKEENSLVLRVLDAHGDQPRGKQDANLHPRGCVYMRVTGIWQTVWLEAVGEAYVASVRMTPDVDGSKINASMSLGGKAEGCKVLATVYFNSVEEAKVEGDVKAGLSQLEIRIPRMKLWSPERPDLYDIEFKLLRREEVLDQVWSYFGIRKVSVRDGKICLNNEPYYLKMALDQGYYPDGLYTAPKDEDLKRDVEAAKLLGLNGVRKHQIAPDPRYLYWCDKLGLLVWGEMADWGMALRNKDAFWDEWKDIINRDFNHPCIMAWVPFNERSSAYENEEEQRALVEIYQKTKELDPTRLVVDNSGYVHTETDIVDIHDYTGWKGGYTFTDLWQKYRKEGGEPPSPHRPLMAKGFKYRGQPIVISEWGGWAIRGFKPILNRPLTHYGPILEDEYSFISKYRDVMEALMTEEAVCGFCYTQLYDVEGEVNGFLTYDRKWKAPPEKIAKIHATMP